MTEESALASLRRSAQEPEAFAGFYDAHAQALLAYLARRVYDAEIALDLTAETFAQAYASRHRFRGTTDRAAAAWLYRIAKRQLARYFRKGRAEKRALGRLGVRLPDLDEEQTARIEELAEIEGLRGVVREELARLSSAQRAALELRVVEQLPYPQVATRLNISEQTARARVSRGLRRLAQALDQSSMSREVHD
jgi:RNA polymerase sigma factor (sigma-70 family)